MARIFTENFEDGINGAVISTANSGYVAVSAALSEFTNATVVEGNLAVDGNPGLNLRTEFTSTAVLYRRFYFWLSGNPSALSVMVNAHNAGSQAVDLRVSSTRTMSVRNGFSAVGTASDPVPLTEWVRAELRYDVPATTLEARFFWGADLHAAVGSYTTRTLATGLTMAQSTVDISRVGNITASSAVNIVLDADALDNADWVGPLSMGDTTPPTMVADHTGTSATFDDAGALVTVDTIGLDSSASTDDVGIVSRLWTETTADVGTFDDATAVAPTFTPSGSGPWTFKVEGTDAADNVGEDTVTVASPDTGGGTTVLSPVLSGTIVPADL